MSVNRRHFIGGMIAAASMPQLAPGGTSVPDRTQVSSKSWVSRGIIDAGGSHEPYIFVVRRGGQRLDAKQSCDYQQSEALIQQLHSQGVEVFHTHFYKGFGMEAESDGMQETVRAVEIAHRLGMKADTYIQWNTMMYETFFLEEPRAVNWIQRNAAGFPILLPYGYQQSFRYRPCFANQDYLDYLKKIVTRAVVEAKTDFIHFDNFDLNAEPDSCHCTWCVSGFRNRLRNKYTAAQLKERFGFERVDYINPPLWNSDNVPSKLQIIYDPAFQEWVDFRCQVMSDALKQMLDLVQSKNPEVVLEINPAGITGQNRSWVSGIDHARLLKYTGSFWSEEGNAPALEEDGRLISRIRSYKLARRYQNILFTYIENNPLALAESLTFNQTLGYLGSGPLSPVTVAYLDFYRQNRRNYEATEDAGNVAVFRSYASLTYNNAAVQLSTILVEQTLIEASIAFELVFDEDLENLGKYRVLILPNSECLSDRQIASIRNFVAAGGGLVVTEQAGLYDEWRRVRTSPGLQGLVSHQDLGTPYQERVGAPQQAAGAIWKSNVGPGRVAYLSQVVFDGRLPPAMPNFAITNEFWKRPRNWKDLLEVIQWTAQDQIAMMVEGPAGVVANCTSQAADHCMFVHILNYDVVRTPVMHAIRVRISLPERSKPEKVTFISPGSAQPKEIDFTRDGNKLFFDVPRLETYATVTIEI